MFDADLVAYEDAVESFRTLFSSYDNSVMYMT